MPAVLAPNYGLVFNQPPIKIPKRALRDGLNFRVKNGTLDATNLGWEKFSENWTLNGPVRLIDNFFPRGQDEKLIFATHTDIYLYDDSTDTVVFLTPSYSTGTASVSGTAVTGVGTNWDPDIDANDEIVFGVANYTGQNPTGNDSFTKVLLHMDGTDASTTFTDSNIGGSAHTWTAAGNAQIDTAQSVFGGASGLFDGTGDWISTPDHADFNLGTSNFSIDFRFRMGGGDGAGIYFAGQTDAGALTAAGSSFYILRNTDGTILAALSDGTAFTTISTVSAYTTAVNTGWHHLEFTRSGSNIYLLIDGVQAATTAFTGTVPNVATVLSIGSRNNSSGPFNGWIDEFRLSVGVARHAAAFTVPTEMYLSAWLEIMTITNDTSITLTSSAGVAVAGPYTIRRLFSDAAFINWSYDTFVNDGTSGDDLWFATNGIEDVVTWNGTDATVTLHPELGFTCTTLSTYSNMMIYGNITQSGELLPSSIINSDVGLPLNAGSTGTGLSEQFVTHSGTDEILNMIPIGDYLVVYAERTIIPIQFVGDPLIFLFRVAISGIGLISSNAIGDFGDFHEFAGADAGYLFDGVTLKETNSHVWRDVLRQADPLRRRQAYGHFDEEQGDLIWSIPLNTDPGVGDVGAEPVYAFPEHYLEEGDQGFDGSPFSKRNFPFTITGFYERATGLTWAEVVEQWGEFNFAWNDQFFQAAFPLNIAGDFGGQIYILNQTQTGDGEPLPNFVRTGRMAMRSGRERDLLTRIYPFARSLPYNLEVNLYMGDFIAGEPGSKGQELFDMNLVEGRHFVTFYRRGRTAEFKFGSSDGNPWVLEGWDYDTKNGGLR
jgi:hypothetical protein